jgi:hypothetical protein
VKLGLGMWNVANLPQLNKELKINLDRWKEQKIEEKLKDEKTNQMEAKGVKEQVKSMTKVGSPIPKQGL